MVVKSELDKLGIEWVSVDLGEAVVKEPLSVEQLKELNQALVKSGLEIMDDRKSQLIEKIKTIVIEQIHYADEALDINFSDFLVSKLNYDYTYLSNLFMLTQGITLEHYIINHKIEKVKELLVYEELTISEIAFKMNYSSAAHLSKQFKKVTGLTASEFKKLQARSISQKDVVIAHVDPTKE
jgi:YesN/AraC family two-component response regulator